MNKQKNGETDKNYYARYGTKRNPWQDRRAVGQMPNGDYVRAGRK